MKKKPSQSNGFTIVELLTAVIIASIFITVVFAAWNYLSKVTARRKRQTTLQSECGRVAHMVTGAIQKAEAVLRYDRTSIWLLDADASDTTVFMFDGTMISRNGSPLHFILPDAQVTEFRFEDVHGNRDEKPYLFDFHCTLIALQGDTASVHTTVMGRRLRDDPMGSEVDFMW